MKALNNIVAIGALVAATATWAADESVLEKIIRVDDTPVGYTLPGKAKGESRFQTGILPSAVGEEEQAPEKTVEYKVRYQVPVTAVRARSQFRNDILSSAIGKAPEDKAEFARFQLMEE